MYSLKFIKKCCSLFFTRSIKNIKNFMLENYDVIIVVASYFIIHIFLNYLISNKHLEIKNISNNNLLDCPIWLYHLIIWFISLLILLVLTIIWLLVVSLVLMIKQLCSYTKTIANDAENQLRIELEKKA